MKRIAAVIREGLAAQITSGNLTSQDMNGHRVIAVDGPDSGDVKTIYEIVGRTLGWNSDASNGNRRSDSRVDAGRWRDFVPIGVIHYGGTSSPALYFDVKNALFYSCRRRRNAMVTMMVGRPVAHRVHQYQPFRIQIGAGVADRTRPF